MVVLLNNKNLKYVEELLFYIISLVYCLRAKVSTERNEVLRNGLVYIVMKSKKHFEKSC